MVCADQDLVRWDVLDIFRVSLIIVVNAVLQKPLDMLWSHDDIADQPGPNWAVIWMWGLISWVDMVEFFFKGFWRL